MVHQLISGDLRVIINSKGAEISSVIHKDREYIWQANPTVWPRHTPVLFPIVGRLKDNKFTYKGKEYTLSQHGFARDKEFNCIEQTNGKIIFELISDEETKKVFPFDFTFRITYEVIDQTIKCSYLIMNPSTSELFFSIGAHPGFRTDDPNGYVLHLEDKLYETTILYNGLLSEQKNKISLKAGELPLQTSLFDKDALVFENNQINSIKLVSKGGTGVELSCKDWPYFGIWSKKDCNEFVCLEPWYGITDSLERTGDITKKKGIIKLVSGEKFDCRFSMRFF